jgi:N-acetylated-alpha-linked acidic dipeptidase
VSLITKTKLGLSGGYCGGVVRRAADKRAVAVLIASNADGGVERGLVLL